MKKIEQQIIKFIQNKVKEAGAKGVVIGLSGGIDSAVTAILCKKALGKNIYGLIMPCESNKQDEKDAKLLAKKFKIDYGIIDLTYPYTTLSYRVPDTLRGKDRLFSGANLKARLRMSTLYYIGSGLNYLVCGTGNKTEIMVGYFTKWGDGGVDLEPIGDLYKTEVIALAKHLGIPKRIINKAPSAGLWKGQTDEDEMGITYKNLDNILKRMEIGNNNPALSEISKVKKVYEMINSSEHKRHLPEIYKIKR